LGPFCAGEDKPPVQAPTQQVKQRIVGVGFTPARTGRE